MENQNYSKEDFWTLLLIYASNVDLEIHELEVKFIIDKFGQETFDKMMSLFKNQSDYETIQWLTKHKTEFVTSEDEKKRMISSIAKLFSADGHIDFMERNMSAMINRLLN